MKAPQWAPADLVDLRQELEAKAREEKSRFEAGEIGSGFGAEQQLTVLNALTVHPEMESVWRSLKRHEHAFQPDRGRSFPYGGITQSKSLSGACLRALADWYDVPKLSRSEHREMHERIAQKSFDLALLLLLSESSDLLDTRKYMGDEACKKFVEALVKDGHETLCGLDHYFEYRLGEYLKPIPRLLLGLHRRAMEAKETPPILPQPRSADAMVHFFIRQISRYFLECYGQPLNAQVATIIRVLFETDDDEDSVRALIRADRLALKKKTRKKIAKIREEIDGE